MRLTWLCYLQMLRVGPLEEEERRIVEYARRRYSRLESGDDPETAREVKTILAKYFKLGQRKDEANPNRESTQALSESLLEIF